jgi:excisionase family DNA binding protein
MTDTTERTDNAQEIRLYSVEQVAGMLGDCSRMTVYRLIAKGLLATVDIGTGSKSRTRIRSDDLAAYINGLTRTA